MVPKEHKMANMGTKLSKGYHSPIYILHSVELKDESNGNRGTPQKAMYMKGSKDHLSRAL